MPWPKLFGCVTVLALAAACPAVAAQGAANGAAEVRLDIVSDPESLDPALMSGDPDFWIANDLFEGLVSWDGTGKLVPGAAATWEISADRLTWTFHLRPHLSWSDGTPLGAEDFVFALCRAVAPATASPYAAALMPIRNAGPAIAGTASPDTLGVSAPDPSTLVIHLDHPTPYLSGIMALPVSFPIDRAVIARYGDKWAVPGKLVGNGAFLLVSWVPNGEVVLERSPAYRGAASVRLDRVRYVIDEDRQAAVKRYLAGEIDETQILGSDVPWARRTRPGDFVAEALPATEHLIVNMAHKPLGGDVRLRQALSLAIDRQTLAGKVDPRGGAAAYSLVPPGLGSYQPQPIDTNQSDDDRHARARALLSAALGAGKPPLTVRLSTYKTDISHRIVQGIAAMWRQNLGINVEIDEPEWRVWDAAFHRGDFDIVLYDWTADYDDAWSFLASWESTAGMLNPGKYDNPAYDALLEQSKTATASDRNALLGRAEHLLLSDYAAIPLEYDVLPYLVSPRLTGWQGNSFELHPARYIGIKP